jgi:hypothetical protein
MSGRNDAEHRLAVCEAAGRLDRVSGAAVGTTASRTDCKSVLRYSNDDEDER